jgi:hypothetical protein
MILISGKDLDHLKGELSTLAENQRQLAMAGTEMAEVQRNNFKFILVTTFICGVLMFLLIRKNNGNGLWMR